MSKYAYSLNVYFAFCNTAFFDLLNQLLFSVFIAYIRNEYNSLACPNSRYLYSENRESLDVV